MRKPSEAALLASSPWMPVKFELADAAAIQALSRGVANAEQQARAWNWILAKACALPDWPYHPLSDRDTNIALGRQFVGHQIMKLQQAPLSKMRRDANADPHEPQS